MMGQDSNTIFPEIPREEELEAPVQNTPYRNPGLQGPVGQYPTPALDAQVIPSAESPNGPSWAKNYNMD
jgi:hypothetical protein